MVTYDEKSICAARDFNPNAEATYNPESHGGIEPNIWRHAVDCGTLFEPNILTLSHDNTLNFARKQFSVHSKEFHVDLFLSALSTNKFYLRSGLRAYSMIRNLMMHRFVPSKEGPYCSYCGLDSVSNKIIRNVISRGVFRSGYVYASVEGPAQTLAIVNKCEHTHPSSDEISVMINVLQVIANSYDCKNVSQLAMARRWKGTGFVGKREHRQYFLETLGFCGILLPPGCENVLTEHVRYGVAPRKSHSSDWEYPADFWKGEDGLNFDAITFWFGAYEEIARFVEENRGRAR